MWKDKAGHLRTSSVLGSTWTVSVSSVCCMDDKCSCTTTPCWTG